MAKLLISKRLRFVEAEDIRIAVVHLHQSSCAIVISYVIEAIYIYI